MLWDEPKIFFLERRYFFSIILSEFLKNRVALQQYNQLYIKSKRLGKRCKVRQNCMVNPSSLSEVSQLLMQISSDEETSVIARAFQLFQNDYVFLPRISLEDVVVFPKRWNLPLHLFALHSQESFEESFQKLRRKYTIDDIVYLSEGDRRLALNLDKAYSMEILYKHIQKNNSLRLSEIEKIFSTKAFV